MSQSLQTFLRASHQLTICRSSSVRNRPAVRIHRPGGRAAPCHGRAGLTARLARLAVPPLATLAPTPIGRCRRRQAAWRLPIRPHFAAVA